MAKLPVPISFNWDQANLEKNWRKHKVHYKEAEEVFLNKPLSIRKDITHSQKENRYAALGTTNNSRELYIVFTIRKGNTLRVISARNQSKKERRLYDKEKAG
ncbi:BrnT family toxin [Patescibacteria group bacterium]|nr:BrnT family toxin [Patescibacteria group bacterium]